MRDPVPAALFRTSELGASGSLANRISAPLYLPILEEESGLRPIPIRDSSSWQKVHLAESRDTAAASLSTHGHRFLADIFLGTTASRVQHSVSARLLQSRLLAVSSVP